MQDIEMDKDDFFIADSDSMLQTQGKSIFEIMMSIQKQKIYETAFESHSFENIKPEELVRTMIQWPVGHQARQILSKGEYVLTRPNIRYEHSFLRRNPGNPKSVSIFLLRTISKEKKEGCYPITEKKWIEQDIAMIYFSGLLTERTVFDLTKHDSTV